MKRLGKWLLAFVAVLAVAFLALRTPDTDPAAMRAKYGGAPSRFVDLGGGLTVHLRDEGPRNAPVLVLLHGSNADLHTWDAWTRAMPNLRVIRYDQIGHGLTGPNTGGGHSPEAMVAVLERLRAKLGIERFSLAGNSMGGGVAAQYAMRYPQHLTALVLLDAGGAPKAGGERGNIGFTLAATPGVNLLMQSITPRRIVERSLRQSVSNQAVVTEAAVDRYWELLRYPGNRAATMERFSGGRRTFSPAQIAAIKTPSLILWGEEDGLIGPEAARWYTRGIAGSQLKIYPGVGHLPHEEVAKQSADDANLFVSLHAAADAIDSLAKP
ncbi:MAG: alpha/beta fold hydrolase [Novosphingobium sp.]